MRRTPVTPDLTRIPEEFHPLMQGAAVYDSSCSPIATVYLIDRDGGYYLKTSAKNSLRTEADLTRFFHEKHLAAEVVAYRSESSDWLLTTAVPGEDCTHADYLADPKRLCDLIAELLRSLHEMDPTGCPVADHRTAYLQRAEAGYQSGAYAPNYLPEELRHLTADEAWKLVEQGKHLLCSDTLLHGDYCLPNIMLYNWNFSGFIDLGNGGIGDRHVDLYWGAWTLWRNLGTEQYRERFFDAYGRDKVDPDRILLVSAAETFG